MTGLFKQMFGSERPYVLSQQLPTEGWAYVPGIGRMSLVWPWYDVPDPQQLVDSYGREVDISPQLELRAPRSDRDVVLIVWSDSSSGPGAVSGTPVVVGADWGRSLLGMYPGSRVEQNSPMKLGGVVGRIVRVSNQRESTWRLVVPRYSSTVHVEVSVPAVHANAYWAQIETMLSTWGWND